MYRVDKHRRCYECERPHAKLAMYSSNALAFTCLSCGCEYTEHLDYYNFFTVQKHGSDYKNYLRRVAQRKQEKRDQRAADWRELRANRHTPEGRKEYLKARALDKSTKRFNKVISQIMLRRAEPHTVLDRFST